MGMVFCRGCGKEIHESAPTCPQCGAPQSIKNTTTDTIPDGIKGWSWGAFLLSWVWAIGNKTWIGLLALIPYVGFIMAIVLGFKGREWAWKNKQWDSIEHFNEVQKKWSFWGVMIIAVVMVIGILAAIAIPAYRDYQHRAQEVAATKQAEVELVANDAKELEAKHQAEIAATNALADFSGEYVDENAVVDLKQEGKAVNFSINSSVGQHACNLEGTAVMMDATSAAFTPEDKTDKCVVLFNFAGGSLKITTKDCGEYCGMAAEGSMDGSYRKKPL